MANVHVHFQHSNFGLFCFSNIAWPPFPIFQSATDLVYACTSVSIVHIAIFAALGILDIFRGGQVCEPISQQLVQEIDATIFMHLKGPPDA